MGIEESILQRLRNKARERGVPFQLVLQLFCQEGFLRRMSKSKYKENLIFKGGLLLYSLSNFEGRPTMDIDFLGKNITNNKSETLDIITDIINISSEYEFIDFEIVGSQYISKDKKYPGVSIKIIGNILNTKTTFKIDIGIGDVIFPKLKYISYTLQLENFSETELLSYPLESVIAEKWETILSRMETTSRMKDYYDIFYLACSYDFDGKVLCEAINKTFSNREVSFDISTLKKVVVIYENQDMRNKWVAFTRKTLNIDIAFNDIVKIIAALLYKPTEAIISKEMFFGKWSAQEGKYI